MMKIKLDDYEKEIEKHAGKSRPLSQAERKRVEAAIEKSKKKKNINIRISEQDLLELRMRSSREGMPYQTLISSVLHKYLTNRLVDEEQVMHTVRLLRKR